MGLTERCQRRGWISNSCSLGVQRMKQGTTNGVERICWIRGPGKMQENRKKEYD